MKKIHENHSEQSNSLGVSSDTKTSRNRDTKPSTVTRNSKKRRAYVVDYEVGDLRGIVAEALAKSTDPYRALFESGVVKSAAEFLNSSDR